MRHLRRNERTPDRFFASKAIRDRVFDQKVQSERSSSIWPKGTKRVSSSSVSPKIERIKIKGRCEKHLPFAVYNGLSKIPLLENKLVIILYFTRLIVSLQQKWFEIPISLRTIVLV